MSAEEKAFSHAESIPAYEGYTFFKADPPQGQDATWHRVERAPMFQSQAAYFKKIQKRATQKPAAQQYQSISSNTRRAHIDQLIDEQRHMNPFVEWSCVYVKERTKPSKARNAHRGDYETVSMDVIIMQRSMKTAYSRTPMGNQVDLGTVPRSLLWTWAKHHSLRPSQNATMEGHQSPVTLPNARPKTPTQDHDMHANGRPGCSQEPTQSTTTITMPPSPVLSAANSSDMGSGHASGWSSEGSSSLDDEAMPIDPPEEICETEDPVDLVTKYQTPLPKTTLHRHEGKSLRRGSSQRPRSSSRANSHSRSLERRVDRRMLPREQFVLPAAKSLGSMKLERARSKGPVSGRTYRMQLMSNDEARSRVLDQREASLGHRERRLKRSYYEAHRLELQPPNDSPPACHCTCRCALARKETD